MRYSARKLGGVGPNKRWGKRLTKHHQVKRRGWGLFVGEVIQKKPSKFL